MTLIILHHLSHQLPKKIKQMISLYMKPLLCELNVKEALALWQNLHHIAALSLHILQ